MTLSGLKGNFPEWLKTATASDMVVILLALGRELCDRKWPTSGSCYLAARELQRFIDVQPSRTELRR